MNYTEIYRLLCFQWSTIWIYWIRTASQWTSLVCIGPRLIKEGLSGVNTIYNIRYCFCDIVHVPGTVGKEIESQKNYLVCLDYKLLCFYKINHEQCA